MGYCSINGGSLTDSDSPVAVLFIDAGMWPGELPAVFVWENGVGGTARFELMSCRAYDFEGPSDRVYKCVRGFGGYPLTLMRRHAELLRLVREWLDRRSLPRGCELEAVVHVEDVNDKIYVLGGDRAVLHAASEVDTMIFNSCLTGSPNINLTYSLKFEGDKVAVLSLSWSCNGSGGNVDVVFYGEDRVDAASKAAKLVDILHNMFARKRVTRVRLTPAGGLVLLA